MIRRIALIATLASCAISGAAFADEQADPNVNTRHP